MTKEAKDPTELMCQRASEYPEVDEGTACTQSSFKTGKKAFFFVGMQGGRYKTMFKLNASRPEAAKLAKAAPDCYQIGTSQWVTARFTAEDPMPAKIWKKWLDESYKLSRPGSAAKKTAGKRPRAARKK